MMSRTGLDTLTTMTKSRRRRYLAAEVKLLNHSFNEVRKSARTPQIRALFRLLVHEFSRLTKR